MQICNKLMDILFKRTSSLQRKNFVQMQLYKIYR